jgi:hypothetical protein
MLKKIFLLFLLHQVAKATAKSDSETRDIPPCLYRMFTLENSNINLDYVNSLKLNVHYRLKLTNEEPIGSYSLFDFVRTCLNSIVFQVRARTTGITFNETYMITEKDNLTGFLRYEIRNQTMPFTLYDIQIGYQQKLPQVDTVFMLTKSLTTCFGQPSDPVSVRLSKFLNGSQLIEWDSPLIVNSPQICYYMVRRRYFDEQIDKENQTNVRSYFLDRNDVDRRLLVSVIAINNAVCYTAQYPVAASCTNKIEISSGRNSRLEVQPAVNYLNSAEIGLINKHLLYFVFFASFLQLILIRFLTR